MNLEMDERWMSRALQVALGGWGTTHPNPVVGAVLADGDTLLSEGYHAKAGGPHAEVEALQRWGGRPIPESATLYVTLEPCSTEGRTPACTKAIQESGVRRVVVGAIDDDERHRGRGLEMLRSAGVTVSTGVLADQCRDLNLIFHFYHRTGQPLVAGKVATTIDGRTATSSGTSKWITGEESRRNVHHWRRYFPAIAVGSGTVLADDPSLTARVDSNEFCPMRLIFDRTGRLAASPDRRVLTDRFRDRTVVFVHDTVFEHVRGILPEEVKVERCLEGAAFSPFLLEWLRANELLGVYVEGGSVLLGSLFHEGAIDYLFAYRAPKLFLDEGARPLASGRVTRDPSEAIELEECQHETFDSDQLLRGFVRYPKSEENES